jgi:tetratricopeptide (TPR) repeat protein
LKERTPDSISDWLEKNLESTNSIESCVRFIALFHRIGDHSADKAIFDALLEKFDASPDEHRWALLTDYFQQLQRFGLDERRKQSIVRALRNWNPDTEKSPPESTEVPGFPQGISAPPATPSKMFAKAYPFISNSAYRIYYVLHRTRPDLSLEDRIEILEALNAGRKPQTPAFSNKKLDSLVPILQQAMVFAPTQEITNSNSMRFAPDGTIDPVNSRMACELANALDTMGETQHAVNILDAFPNSLYASVEKAHLLKKLGRIGEALELANEILGLNTRLSLYLHTRAAKLLRDCGEHTAWLAAQQLYASQVKPWANYVDSFQDTPPALRPELEPEIEHLLIHQWNSCAFLWTDSLTMDTILTWNILGLVTYYHDSATKHPERIGLVADLSRASCIFEISLILQSAFISTNTNQQAAANFILDWNRLTSIFANTIGTAFWQAVLDGDEARAERLLHTSHRLSPEEINTLIDAIPLIRKSFGNETLERWFHIYYDPMLKHLDTYPDDLLIGNNAAWLCAKCELDIERGYELAKRVTARDPTDTFLDTLAELEFVRGNRDAAIELSLKCKSLNPRDPHHSRQIRRYSQSTVLSKP